MRKIISKLIILCTIVITLFSSGVISVQGDDTPLDVTDLVTFKSVNVYKKSSPSGPPEYIIKDDVLQSNAPVIKVGDYFYATLPEYFNFSNSSNATNLVNKQGETIGTLELVEHEGRKKLKATLGEGAFENIALEQGYLFAVGRASEAREEVEVGQGTRPSITIEEGGSGEKPPLSEGAGNAYSKRWL